MNVNFRIFKKYYCFIIFLALFMTGCAKDRATIVKNAKSIDIIFDEYDACYDEEFKLTNHDETIKKCDNKVLNKYHNNYFIISGSVIDYSDEVVKIYNIQHGELILRMPADELIKLKKDYVYTFIGKFDSIKTFYEFTDSFYVRDGVDIEGKIWYHHNTDGPDQCGIYFGSEEKYWSTNYNIYISNSSKKVETSYKLSRCIIDGNYYYHQDSVNASIYKLTGSYDHLYMEEYSISKKQ